MELRLNGATFPVTTMEMASRMVRDDIDASDTGSSEWYGADKQQGWVFSGGEKVGHISYNGRIWLTGDK
jgi:hypothetical protein